jgi:ABC-2 type transport system permease protein
LYLALFGPLLKGLPGASLGGSGNAYRFFVPGLLIQLALFGSTFVGFAIISDWWSGVIERFRVTPVSRLAIMAGRVLRDVVTLVVQAVVLVLVGVAFGLRAPLPAVLIGSCLSCSSPSGWPRCRTPPAWWSRARTRSRR